MKTGEKKYIRRKEKEEKWSEIIKAQPISFQILKQ